MIIYIWKSVNGFVPSLGLGSNNKSTGRSGPTLNIEAIRGKVLSAKTLKAHSLKNHETAIFNMLPIDLKTFDGTVNQFKNKLDRFLTLFPDRPHMDGQITGATNLEGDPSNSLKDWLRVLDWVWEDIVVSTVPIM